MNRFETNLQRGLYAHNPTEFNIDKKLRPQDPLKLIVNGKECTHNMKKWLEVDPIRIWIKLYKPQEYFSIYNSTPGLETSKLSLCHNTHKSLVAAIKKVKPELIEELKQKKKKKALIRKYAAGKLKPVDKKQS